MKWTGLNELREKFLSFYESKGHLRLPSFSLLPQDDNSLLLINSGMAPMKKYFTGEVTPPRKRVTTCQKCIRTPDIERVGKTARHGTYFEMLGNFSFGDYFKSEATAWAWEFCTKVLEMPLDKLWVTIYLDDDEAFDIWTKQVGVPADRIVRLGKEDNFWEHGTGPCGPCSEIYFDRGEEYGCGSPTCGVGCDCDRYTEFWNLVFTQFNSDGNDNYEPLEHPNIDTGMGLERLACIMQGVDNLFEVDTVQNIMKKISEIAGVKYHDNEKDDISLRVITDHIRSSVFMISDGVMPSNEGRGYVLRRLIRRACRHGKLLRISGPFLYKVVDSVVAENEGYYPNLREKRDIIVKVIENEEASFSKLVDAGLNFLDNFIKNNEEGTVFTGEEAFKLYDTYGFPIDLTKDILEEANFTVDEKRFEELMTEQKIRTRNARKDAGADAWLGDKNLFGDIAKTDFTGYEVMSGDNLEVLAIVTDGERRDMAAQGDECKIVLNSTPFYAQSGGQVGDIGVIKTADSEFEVTDTTKTKEGVYIHHGKVVKGVISVSDKVSAQVDVDTRKAIMSNHTAAHLLQAALRQVLGSHVEQAGQLVNDKEVRFDFTHFSALSEEEIAKVESVVNEKILEAGTVTTKEMPIDEAKKLGAMALFGEKYGDIVRVVNANDFSIEFCGGTHVDNTAKLGLFKIISEQSVAAGVRRIVALTGLNLINYFTGRDNVLKSAAEVSKIGTVEALPEYCKHMQEEVKSKDRTIKELRAKMATADIDSQLESALDLGVVKLFVTRNDGMGVDELRTFGDAIKSKCSNIVALIAGVDTEKGSASILCVCGADAVKAGVKAGDVVREVARLAGGGGGGRPDSAMAGAKNLEKLGSALAQAENIVKSKLEG